MARFGYWRGDIIFEALFTLEPSMITQQSTRLCMRSWRLRCHSFLMVPEVMPGWQPRNTAHAVNPIRAGKATYNLLQKKGTCTIFNDYCAHLTPLQSMEPHSNSSNANSTAITQNRPTVNLAKFSISLPNERPVYNSHVLVQEWHHHRWWLICAFCMQHKNKRQTR